MLARATRVRVRVFLRLNLDQVGTRQTAMAATAAESAGSRRPLSTRTASEAATTTAATAAATAAAMSYPAAAAAAARSFMEEQQQQQQQQDQIQNQIHRASLSSEVASENNAAQQGHQAEQQQEDPPPLPPREAVPNTRAGHQEESGDVDGVATIMPEGIEEQQQQQQKHQQQQKQQQQEEQVVLTGGGGDLRLGEFMEEVKTELWQYDAMPLRRRFRVQSLLRRLRTPPFEMWTDSLVRATDASQRPFTRTLLARNEGSAASCLEGEEDAPGFDLLLLCWRPGAASVIHDHPQAGCWVKVLKGEIKETRYTLASPPGHSLSASSSSSSFIADMGHQLHDDDHHHHPTTHPHPLSGDRSGSCGVGVGVGVGRRSWLWW